MLDGQLQWPGYQVLRGWLVIKKFTFFRSLLVTHDMPLFLKWVSCRCSKVKSCFFISFDNVCILIGMYRLVICNAIIDKARLKYHLDRCFLIYLFALSLYKQSKIYYPVLALMNIFPLFLSLLKILLHNTHIIQKELQRDHRRKGEK